MDSILSFLDKAIGPIFGIGFFGFMIWLFYWLIVVAPKKIGLFFKELEKEGYRSLEHEDRQMKHAIDQLVPPHPKRTSGGPNVTEWRARQAVKKIESGADSYIALVNRSEAHVGDEGRKNYVQTTLIFFQERALALDGVVYFTPKKNKSSNRWKEYFGAEELLQGYQESVHQSYHIFSPEKRVVPLPGELEQELVEICDVLCQRELFCFNNGVNLKFSPQGWGICPDNYAYKKEHLQLLIDLFLRIDHTLSMH